MVAYTPDKDHGEKDRQMRVSLGRFLTKYFPQFPDDYIRGLVEEHLADLDDSFEQLYGLDILEAYRNGSMSSCMTYDEQKYLDGNPTIAYNAPNISMAVLRNPMDKTKFTARCMLYTPSEKDKRYIRMYGDAKLTKKLQRNGYKAGNWIGAKFNTVEIPPEKYRTFIPPVKGAKAFVVPYLDANGNAGSDQFCSLAVIDGVLQVLPYKAANAIRAHYREIDGPTFRVQSGVTTAGYRWLVPINTSDFTQKCFLTGAGIDPFVAETTSYWDGESVQTVLAEAVEGFPYVQVPQLNRKMYVAVGTPTFLYNGVYIVDTPASREACNFVKLDPLIYPANQEWVRIGRLALGAVKTRRNTYILSEEAVRIYENDIWGWDHNSLIDKTYTKMHPLNGRKAYAAPGVVYKRTVSGAKVMDGRNGHEVTELYDGTWDFDRNVENTQVLNMRFSYTKSKRPPTAPGSELYAKAFQEFVGNFTDMDHALYDFVSYHIGGSFPIDGRQLYNINRDDVTVDNIKEGFKTAAVGMCENDRAQIAYALAWYDRWLAEAAALDYTNAYDNFELPKREYRTTTQNRDARMNDTPTVGRAFREYILRNNTVTTGTASMAAFTTATYSTVTGTATMHYMPISSIPQTL